VPIYIDDYEIDAVISEDSNKDADVTDNPVEQGDSTTDHVRLKPKSLTLDCLVSDTPYGDLADRRSGELGGIGGVNDLVISEDARQRIEAIQDARKPVLITVTTKRGGHTRFYENMILQTLGENVAVDNGDAYRFKATFKQMNFITNNRTTVKVAVPKAKKKNDKGELSAKDANAGKKEKKRGSALKAISGYLNGGETNYKTGFHELFGVD